MKISFNQQNRLYEKHMETQQDIEEMEQVEREAYEMKKQAEVEAAWEAWKEGRGR